MTGRIFFVAAAMIPARVAISMNPIQKDITPSIVMQSETASFDESIAAVVISGSRPVHAAYTIPIIIIPAHK